MNADFFINNRARLRSLFEGTAPIVITANGLLQQNGDMAFPFKQDSSFWYFTGINEPDLILVMDKSRDYIILPLRPHFTDIAEGQLNLADMSAKSGIKLILDNQEGWRKLSSKIKRSKHAAIVPPPLAYIEHYGFFTNPARSHLKNKLKELNSDISFLDISKHIAKLRLIKQPVEVDSINQAIKITADAIKKITKNISKYRYEYEIDAAILYEFKRNNSSCAFTNVVSVGKNSTAIHYAKGDSELLNNELLLMDVGAEINHYAADITRTIAISGKMTKRQGQVFDSVSEVQQYAYSLLKPGVIYKEYDLGLITTIDRDSVRKYYPHLTSHFLGLDAHDVGDFMTSFQENMLITVEPGIYIPEEGIGVRLEDDILISADGYKNLSANLPSSFN
jgi:Xaa-Pro aminopeptidase